jgi:CheY-like chemotaxis protein
MSAQRPRILVINDDRKLLKTRKLLLEENGAIVYTACGVREAIQETLTEPADLVLIDATNVGLDHAEMLCEFVKSLHPNQCVALLVRKDTGRPQNTRADRVIFRGGPRQFLTEVNELIGGRFDLNFWRRGKDERAPSSSPSQE